MYKFIGHFLFVLLVPFSGLGFVSKPQKLASLVIYFILFFVVIVVTRWITFPAGFMVMVMHLPLAAMVAIYVGMRTQIQTKPQYFLSVTLSTFFLLTITGTFIYRESMLGINVFYIPSESMEPTLLPGDIILVDSWSYYNSPAEIGDVAVFRLPHSQATFVKRIIDSRENNFSAAGDNTAHTISKAGLSNIDNKYLRGQVKFVITNLGKSPFLERRLTKTINPNYNLNP
jgi:signal peptidase I